MSLCIAWVVVFNLVGCDCIHVLQGSLPGLMRSRYRISRTLQNLDYRIHMNQCGWIPSCQILYCNHLNHFKTHTHIESMKLVCAALLRCDFATLPTTVVGTPDSVFGAGIRGESTRENVGAQLGEHELHDRKSPF